MTEYLGLATVLLLWVLVFLANLSRHSLRSYSRSRLDELCQSLGKPSRFSLILKWDEQALFAADLVALLTMALLVVMTVTQLNVPPIPSNPWTSGDVWAWVIFLSQVALQLVLLVVVGVILPWTIARVGGARFVFHSWPALHGVLTVLRPILSLSSRFDRMIHRMSGMPDTLEEKTDTLTEEIRTVVDAGQRGGAIETEARTMIHRVMELYGEDVARIMTPRTEMVCINADATLEEARKLILEAGHSRIPVIEENADQIVGILYAKQLLEHITITNGQQVQVRKLVREPYYVPETTHIETLLEQMRRNKVHLAIVIDEYSGTAGLVTMEDILEEIVGDIADEFDPAEEQEVQVVGENVTIVDGRMHIDDLNEQFQYALPENRDFDTVGGFVMNELGRIPKQNEEFTYRNLRVKVLEAEERKVRKVRFEIDKSFEATPVEP